MITIIASPSKSKIVLADATTDNVTVVLPDTRFSRAITVVRSDSSGNTVTVKTFLGATVTTVPVATTYGFNYNSTLGWVIVTEYPSSGGSLPDQTGHGGEFLTTDGSVASWVALAGGGDLLSTNNLSDLANAGTARTNLGLAIGTNVQAFDATLAAFAALTIAANSLTIGTGVDAFSQTTFAANTFPARASTGNLVAKVITDFGLSLVDDADAAAGRTTLGLGTLATQNGTFSGTSSGTNTGDQTSIVGITGTKAQFDTAVTDGNFSYVGDAPTAHPHDWADITGEPSTLAGYGITDGATDAELAAHEADTTAIHGIANTALLLTTATKLDDLAAPDDNVDLNASTGAHGLMQKYPGGTTNFLRADGTFAAPPGGAAGDFDLVIASPSTISADKVRVICGRYRLDARITIDGRLGLI